MCYFNDFEICNFVGVKWKTNIYFSSFKRFIDKIRHSAIILSQENPNLNLKLNILANNICFCSCDVVESLQIDAKFKILKL